VAYLLDRGWQRERLGYFTDWWDEKFVTRDVDVLVESRCFSMDEWLAIPVARWDRA
jgi:hypothetical protein